ncbi:MAG: pyridoxamine 5'-phosphate oxidase [Rhizobiaceae bacterium]
MDFTERTEPFALFNEWLNEAKESEPNDHNALSLATVDPAGMPNVRMVLLKGHDERGFVFYTNFGSIKGQEIQSSMKAAMGFHWKSLRRQIRIRGPLEQVSDEEADAYYNSRHPQSRLGAWASDQSKPLSGRAELVENLRKAEEKYGNENIPRPTYWSGMRVIPETIEFWKDGEFRLHDRIVFTRDADAPTGWSKQRLYP